MDDRASTSQTLFNSPFASARVQNALLEMLRWYQQQQRLGQVGNKLPVPLLTDTVALKNLVGATMLLGEGLEVGDYLLDEPDTDHPWLDGNNPTADQRDYFGVLLRGLADEAIADANQVQLSGVCFALVNKASEYHKYVKLNPAAGEGLFSSDYFGSDYFGDGYFTSEEGDRPKLVSDWFGSGEILKWCEAGEDGELWALVRMGSRTWPTYYGKLDSDTDAGEKGTVSFWSGTHGEETDSTANIENVLTRVADLSEGDEVYVSWVGGPDNGGPEMVLIC